MKCCMSHLTFMFVFIAALGFLAVTGCSNAGATKDPKAATPAAKADPKPAEDPIRKVDFKNFSYKSDEAFTLKDGKWESGTNMENTNSPELSYELNEVQYGNFLNNGREQAAVMLTGVTPGASCCEWKEVHVFDMRDGKAVEAGQLNAQGMSITPAQQVISTTVPLYAPEDGQCCPSRIMQTHYRWDGQKFAKSRVQIYPSSDADTFTPDYSEAKLPDVYHDDAACPFECCALGQWTANDSFAVYAKPDADSEVIDRIAVGESFESLQGIADVKPGKYNVVKFHNEEFDGMQFDEGDTFYELTYLGEGYSKFWYYGHEDAIGLFDVCGDEYATDQCWLERKSQADSVWWVKVKLGDGTLGWVMDPFNVDGAYGCG